MVTHRGTLSHPRHFILFLILTFFFPISLSLYIFFHRQQRGTMIEHPKKNVPPFMVYSGSWLKLSGGR